MADLMTTREVADYLRIKERTVYELVRTGRIPCSRVTGKWLFPRALIDDWVADSAIGAVERKHAGPVVVMGSHDPLLEWALRESRSELALRTAGSLDGLARLAAGEAMIAAIHLYDAASGEYNVTQVKEALDGRPVVVIHWAWRDQGLLLAPGNPLAITRLADLAAAGARVVIRQDEAGSRLLFDYLLARDQVARASLQLLPQPARSESDVALAVREGKADSGLAIAAVARPLGLHFLPLHRERFDLVMGRRDFFEEPVQALMAFSRTPAFAARAAEMGGYDISALGQVLYNGP